MYWDETHHSLPHFHAHYAEYKASFDMAGEVIVGEFPQRQLRLTFENGTVGDVSFTDREWKGVFEPLRDPKRFARVSIEFGTLAWPDDGLDMAPEPLYAAALEHQVPQAARMTA